MKDSVGVLLPGLEKIDAKNIGLIFSPMEKSVLNILIKTRSAINVNQIINTYMDYLLMIADAVIQNKIEEIDKNSPVRLLKYPNSISLKPTKELREKFIQALKNSNKKQSEFEFSATTLSQMGFEVPGYLTIKRVLENLEKLGLIIKREDTLGRSAFLYSINPEFIEMLEAGHIRLLL